MFLQASFSDRFSAGLEEIRFCFPLHHAHPARQKHPEVFKARVLEEPSGEFDGFFQAFSGLRPVRMQENRPGLGVTLQEFGAQIQ